MTIKLDKNLATAARTYGATTNRSLSDVIEESLLNTVPSRSGVQFIGDPKEMRLEFISGPTVATMKPNSMGAAVPGQEIKSHPFNGGVPSTE